VFRVQVNRLVTLVAVVGLASGAMSFGRSHDAASAAEPDVEAAIADIKAKTEALVAAARPRLDALSPQERLASPPVIWRVPGAITEFRDCAGCPHMVVIPAGEFTMGSPPAEQQAEAQHRVTIAAPFAVSKFEITFDEWEACVRDSACSNIRPNDEGWGRGQHPVIHMSFDTAKAYVAWLTKTTGKTYRLPSEAEREYVTRAGTTTPYWWGSSISGSQANYDSRMTHAGGVDGVWLQKTVPVDTFAPNPWGLYNVHGNVYEWMEDCQDFDNAKNPRDGTAKTTGDCSHRMARGGAWSTIHAADLRAAARVSSSATERDTGFGFRVVRTLD